MEFAAMKNKGVKLFNRILNYVGCTNILYGAGSCVCFCRRAGAGSSSAGVRWLLPCPLLFPHSSASYQRFQLPFWINTVLVSVTPDCDEWAWVCDLWKLSRKGEDRQLRCSRVCAPCSGLALAGDVSGRGSSSDHRDLVLWLLLSGLCCPGAILNELHPVSEWWRGWHSTLASVSLPWAAPKGCSGTWSHFKCLHPWFLPLASPPGKVGCSLMGFPSEKLDAFPTSGSSPMFLYLPHSSGWAHSIPSTPARQLHPWLCPFHVRPSDSHISHDDFCGFSFPAASCPYCFVQSQPHLVFQDRHLVSCFWLQWSGNVAANPCFSLPLLLVPPCVLII